MSDRERAKEWIDEISSQEVDRFLYFLNLCLTKRDLYYEKCELKKEIDRLQQELQRKDNNWNELKEFIENELNRNADKEKSFGGYQCKIILDKINELEKGR